jgi:hypothetical protein
MTTNQMNKELKDLVNRDFFDKNRIFTSVDVKNAILASNQNMSTPLTIRSRDVSAYLKTFADDGGLVSNNYSVTRITIINEDDDGELEANVYHPNSVSEYDYKTDTAKAKPVKQVLNVKTTVKQTISDSKGKIVKKTKAVKVNTSNMSADEISEYISSSFNEFYFHKS